eukprot:CAMPEP_0179236768 /NCGR_PEP_ID=MMETSP0797-20121207/14097_1 /TAXON_ID=47934 /ORGANISM="Dinophysis acuminata, Strain DAEP01" /LENGTH=297 /DNA_ID=CAMNT_0020944033 /DNA_START=1 /DNA_END=892 /DNA_ORIENTATION=+
MGVALTQLFWQGSASAPPPRGAAAEPGRHEGKQWLPRGQKVAHGVDGVACLGRVHEALAHRLVGVGHDVADHAVGVELGLVQRGVLAAQRRRPGVEDVHAREGEPVLALEPVRELVHDRAAQGVAAPHGGVLGEPVAHAAVLLPHDRRAHGLLPDSNQHVVAHVPRCERVRATDCNEQLLLGVAREADHVSRHRHCAKAAELLDPGVHLSLLRKNGIDVRDVTDLVAARARATTAGADQVTTRISISPIQGVHGHYVHMQGGLASGCCFRGSRGLMSGRWSEILSPAGSPAPADPVS